MKDLTVPLWINVVLAFLVVVAGATAQTPPPDVDVCVTVTRAQLDTVAAATGAGAPGSPYASPEVWIQQQVQSLLTQCANVCESRKQATRQSVLGSITVEEAELILARRSWTPEARAIGEAAALAATLTATPR